MSVIEAELPSDFDACHRLAVSLVSQQRLAEAGPYFEHLLRIRPEDAGVFCSAGIFFCASGRPELAEACWRRALVLNPGFVAAHYNLGNFLQDTKRLDEAEACYRQALQLSPDFVPALNNLGRNLYQQKRFGEAIAFCEEALKIVPDHPDILQNLGVSLRWGFRLAESEALCRGALAIHPGHAGLWHTLAAVLRDQFRWEESAATYRRALELHPDCFDLQWDQTLLMLSLGDFEKGWQAWGRLWPLAGESKLPELPFPCWSGEENLAGKRLLILAEQGFGDMIQMVRYVADLEKQGVICQLAVPPTLQGLFARSFPLAEVIGRSASFASPDFWVPVMSLPLAMRTFSESLIPRAPSYLLPCHERVDFWRRKLACSGGRGACVGFVWRGNPNFPSDHLRSAALADFLPVIRENTGVRFFCLQKGIRADERALLDALGNVEVLEAELSDFDETAAVMQCMDVVVSTCSSPAHLAGALGVRTWVLLSFFSDWRWFVERSDSPWYPSAELFRQRTPGDWRGVMNAVSVSLAALSVRV